MKRPAQLSLSDPALDKNTTVVRGVAPMLIVFGPIVAIPKAAVG